MELKNRESIYLSIILPVYNAEKFIEKCIKSCLNIDNSNIEIIIVNDGSTDNTLSIISKFKDCRIRVYSKQNEGAMIAWKYGLNRANGEYITFIDADDYFSNDALETIIAILKKYNPEVLQFGCNYVNENYLVMGTRDFYLMDGFYSSQNLDNARNKLLPHTGFSGTRWGKCFKTELIKNYICDINVVDFEDYALTFPILSVAKSLYILSKPLYNYVQNQSSVTHNINNLYRAYDDIDIVINYFKSIQNNMNITSEDLARMYVYFYYFLLTRSIKNNCFDLSRKIIKSNLSNINILENNRIKIFLIEHRYANTFIFLTKIIELIRSNKHGKY